MDATGGRLYEDCGSVPEEYAHWNALGCSGEKGEQAGVNERIWIGAFEGDVRCEAPTGDVDVVLGLVKGCTQASEIGRAIDEGGDMVVEARRGAACVPAWVAAPPGLPCLVGGFLSTAA